MIDSFQKTIKTTASTDRVTGSTTRAARNRPSSFSPRSRQVGRSRSSRSSQEPGNEEGKSPGHQESWEHRLMPVDFHARREFQNKRKGASQESRDFEGLRPVHGDRIRCSHSIFSRFRRNRPAITTINRTGDAGGIDRLTWNGSTRVGPYSVGMPLFAWVGRSHAPIRVKDRVCTASAFPATSVAK